MGRYELEQELENILKLMGTLDPTKTEYSEACNNAIRIQKMILEMDNAEIEKIKVDREFELDKEKNENERFKSKVEASSSTKNLIGNVIKTVGGGAVALVGLVWVMFGEDNLPNIPSKTAMNMVKNYFPKIG